LRKSDKPLPLTRSEKRAAALDRWIKRDIAERREADQAKKSLLKELRMAREAGREQPALPDVVTSDPPKREGA
jgi:hypothetical protein